MTFVVIFESNVNDMEFSRVAVLTTIVESHGAAAAQIDGETNALKKLQRIMSADPTDSISAIEFIRKGMEFEDFSSINTDLPFSIKEWSVFLHLSGRTMQRYQKENRTFDPEQTEKIIKIVLLYNKGVDILGDKDKLHAWLEATSVALGGNKPKDLLDSNTGIQLLDDELDRIEHGIFA